MLTPPRPGTTLVELLVALVVGGVVLAMIASIGVRQQRLYADLGRRVAGQEQLRHAGAILPIDVRAASVRDGDIAAGEARDTSLELRATLGSSIVCDAVGSTLSLVAPAADSELASVVDQPRMGDTLWVLDESTDEERWNAMPVRSAWSGDRPCAADRPSSAVAVGAGSATPLVIDTGQPDAASVPAGMPVRITRRVRYDLYRAGDGHWYLGYRDWNGALGRFNVVQPVSGPFLAPASGVRFRYFDAAGREVPAADSETRRITLVTTILRATGSPTLGATAGGRRADSSLIAVALRNRW